MFPDIFPLIYIIHKAIAFHSLLSAAPTFFPNHCLPGVPAVTPLQGPPVPQPWGPSTPKTHPAVPQHFASCLWRRCVSQGYCFEQEASLAASVI